MKRIGLAAGITAVLIAATAGQAAAQESWTDEPIPGRDAFSLLDSVSSADGVTWAFGGWYQGLPAFHSQAYLRGAEDWAEVPVPDIGRLTGGTTVSADDAWAIGQDAKSGGAQTVHWDGTAWTVVPFAPPPASNRLFAFDTVAFAADDVWAVGRASSDDPAVESRGMAQHWDGTAWSDVPVPDVAGHWALAEVAGTGPDDVWAIGQRDGEPGQGVALHWDGTAWSEVPVPEFPGTVSQDVQLHGIAALAADDVWATGTVFSYDDATPSLPVLLHWDGTAWTKQEAPVAGGKLGELVRVGDQLWSLGDTLLRYDGTTWAPVEGPPAGDPVAGTALDDGRLLAVGSAGPGNKQQPFATVHGG
ncbi:hypothetical protein CFN78_10755 [Amycolatopsis antarctica]|uniref:Carbohydrate-binding protein n=1 Tax=Amycolatopsis antarctica TaxID=1854586 RepID=A0A263D4A9_9PSEU|nr:hypothetical protein [Amycolatopsis antarctica]OZM73322.1 hypothetical protein CFN78_10755 [Amycolatopsis antarctica]